MNVNAIILENVQFLPHIRYYSLLLARAPRLCLVYMFVSSNRRMNVSYLLW